MPSSTNLGAYTDAIEIFDRAIASREGIRIPFPDNGSARKMMERLQQARRLVREKSREIYPDASHPGWGTSPYDPLIVRVPRKLGDGRWWVYIQPRLVNAGEIEELGDEASDG